jgi:hypothetical protein
MSGVNIRTATRSGPVNPTVPASGRYFVAGQFERGRTDVAQRVRSLAELEVLYGGRVAYGSAYDDLRMFFEEGGTEAYVIRVVGPAATLGTLMLDGAGAADGVRVDALGAGAWSTGVTVQVAAGTLAATIKVIVNGPLDSDTETYDNLATSADVVTALARSRYVRGTDMGLLPVVAAAAALTAGADDRASITAAHMTGALDKFGTDLGAGSVAIPGYTSALVGANLHTHAKAFNRLAIMAAARGASDADYLTAADARVAPDGEYSGIFGPWVTVPLGGGATKLISPEGYIAAVRARAHLAEGPWASPAGEPAIARFVLGVERELTRAQGDALEAGNVNPIRTIQGSTRLYGWRSLSTDEDNYALLTGRDVLNTVAYAAADLLERHVHRTIDGKGQRIASVAADLVGLLDPMRAAGGLYERIVDGVQLDAGYSVDVGDTVNTLAVLQANTIAAVIALRVSPVGTLIDLTIVKAGLTATV